MTLLDGIKHGFRMVQARLDAIKEGFNEWVLHLQRENDALKTRVELLEKRLRKLELESLRKDTKERII